MIIKAQAQVIAEFAGYSKTKQRAISTIVGGYNIRTGAIVVAWKTGGEDCAEDMVRKALGGNPKEILFTPAYRPRNKTWRDVCLNCQTKYDKSQFAPGTKFEKVPPKNQ